MGRSYPLSWRRLQWAMLGWVDRPCLSETENLTSGRAPCYIWGPNNDDYAVSAQDAVQNNSPKNYILLASWCFLVSPCPRTPALSKPFLLPTPATGSHRTDGGLITGVVWDQNKAGHLLVAVPLPVLAFGGRERKASTCERNICTINRLRLYKTIVLLKMSKGIPSPGSSQDQKTSVYYKDCFKKESEIWHMKNPLSICSQDSNSADICHVYSITAQQCCRALGTDLLLLLRLLLPPPPPPPPSVAWIKPRHVALLWDS